MLVIWLESSSGWEGAIKGAMGIHMSYERGGAIWSYQGFPNHILVSAVRMVEVC